MVLDVVLVNCSVVVLPLNWATFTLLSQGVCLAHELKSSGESNSDRGNPQQREKLQKKNMIGLVLI